jgi:hypothetical protein
MILQTGIAIPEEIVTSGTVLKPTSLLMWQMKLAKSHA